MRRPELTPAPDTSPPADHPIRAHPRFIGGSRLSRAGNRQINTAIHRIAVTQARSFGLARGYIAHRVDNEGNPERSHPAQSQTNPTSSCRALLADSTTLEQAIMPVPA